MEKKERRAREELTFIGQSKLTLLQTNDWT
jgi:hypothetical protein